MPERVSLGFFGCAGEILRRMLNEGVLCTVVDHVGNVNVLTLGWGQIGPRYLGHPVYTIAVTPLRHSWYFLEQVPDFVIAVPDDGLKEAVALCGSASGRRMDKFAAAGLTPVPSLHVRAPSVRECPINVECRIYTRIPPPHEILAPSYRKRPLEEQHTIYFAEVLGTYGWQPDASGSSAGT